MNAPLCSKNTKTALKIFFKEHTQIGHGQIFHAQHSMGVFTVPSAKAGELESLMHKQTEGEIIHHKILEGDHKKNNSKNYYNPPLEFYNSMNMHMMSTLNFREQQQILQS